MEEEQSSQSYFSIVLPGDKTIKFDSQEEIVFWLKKVKDINSPNRQGLQGDTKRIIYLIESTVNERLTELQNTLTAENIHNNPILTSRTAAAYFAERKLLAPETREGQALEDLYATDVHSGVFALLLLLGQSVRSDEGISPAAVRAIMTVGRLDGDLPLNPLRAVSEFRKEFNDELRGFQQKVSEQVGEERAELGKAMRDAAGSMQLIDSALEESAAETVAARRQREEIEVWHETEKDKLSRLRETVETRVQTDAAYEYWITKEERHIKGGRNILWVVTAYIIVIGLSFTYTLHKLPEDRLLDMPFWGIALVGLLVLLAVWGGRLLSRLYLSQEILREEAAERATMVQTYVALVKEGGATAENLSVVLQALFRPAPKGLGHNEGGPVLPQEMIVKYLSGDSGKG